MSGPSEWEKMFGSFMDGADTKLAPEQRCAYDAGRADRLKNEAKSIPLSYMTGDLSRFYVAGREGQEPPHV